MAPFDALICPTVPCVAPTIDEVSASAEAYVNANLRLLRNTGVANMLDGCAITLPCHSPSDGELPVGLMLVGVGGSDRRLLAIAQGVEAALGGEADGPGEPTSNKRARP